MPTIIIVEDHPITSKGFEIYCLQVLKSANIIHVRSIKELMQTLKEDSKISLIILDIFLDGENSMHYLPSLKTAYPLIPVLMSSYGKDIIYGIRSIKQGANGYLNKNATAETIQNAIATTFRNDLYFTREILNYTASILNNKKNFDTPFETLTNREFNVMLLLIKGKDTSEISDLLSLQPTTISTYKFKIFEKLMISNIAELFELASVYNIK